MTASPCRDADGVYRLGVIVRDGMAGIGTLTYVDPETGSYGALGHGVCDSDTGVLLPLGEGTLLHSLVGAVAARPKRQAGRPAG